MLPSVALLRRLVTDSRFASMKAKETKREGEKQEKQEGERERERGGKRGQIDVRFVGRCKALT